MSTTSASGLGNLTMINVVGHEAPYPYGKVKDAVLKLGGEFYFKHDDENIVRVKDPSGKKRYFRKKSKLVQEIAPGKFVHKAFLVKTEDGIFLDKNDSDTIMVNGKYTRKAYAVELGGEWYLRTDSRVKTCTHSGSFGLITDMVQLSQKYYPDGAYVLKAYLANLIELPDGYVITPHAKLILNKDGVEEYIHYKEAGTTQFLNVFKQFRDVTNPQLNRIDFISMRASDEPYTVQVPELGCRVHKNHLEKVLKIYNDVILLREATLTAAIKKALVYSDDGPDENQAKIVKKIPEPWPGKYNIFTPSKMEPTVSKSFKTTGGLKYTFGVELETAQGLVPNEVAEDLKFRIVGDRSIGAGEYVTGVLQGDAGMELLKRQCEAIAKYCFVDDKTGLHVHIRGAEEFTRQFARFAIQLGCQIEPELYATCPESRKPTLKHCHSIMRWKDINDDNWREYLGAFVFSQHEENWNKPWSFEPYSYGKNGYTKATKLGDFCGGRYKWLNLVHILSKSSIKTCELRLFPGTTSFQKVYNYVLLSMAFVWFVENKQGRIIKGDVTLNEVIMTAFEKHPEIWQNMVAFYAERTAKFNRKNMYPKEIPKAIF